MPNRDFERDPDDTGITHTSRAGSMADADYAFYPHQALQHTTVLTPCETTISSGTDTSHDSSLKNILRIGKIPTDRHAVICAADPLLYDKAPAESRSDEVISALNTAEPAKPNVFHPIAADDNDNNKNMEASNTAIEETDEFSTTPSCQLLRHDFQIPEVSHQSSTKNDQPRIDSPLNGDTDDFETEYPFVDYTAYALRPQTRSTNHNLTGAYYDHDTTGDFDPSEEERKVRADRIKARLRQGHGYTKAAAGENAEGSPSEPLPLPELPKLIVELKITSEPGQAALQACLEKPSAQSEQACDDFSDGHHTRGKARFVKSSNKTDLGHEPSTNESDIPSDLTGHPVARGCRACLNLNIHCPLLDDERAWPCFTCSEDDTECELITPPKYKRVCEGCKRRRAACSYGYTHDHVGPCQQCTDGGQKCIAGPDKDLLRTRLRYDRDWNKDPLPPPKKPKQLKTYWTCMQCREGGRDCSFSTGGIAEDCTACEMEGSICVPEQTTVPPKAALTTPQKRCAVETIVAAPRKRPKTVASTKSGEHKTPTKKAKAQSRQTQTKKRPDPEGTTRTISTKLCHPITFNNETATGTTNCNFCDGSSHAILGLDQREVEVIDWEDGHGLTEVSGGHMADGHPSTRVCTTCTMQRVPMVMCAKHELRPNRSSKLKLLDPDGALMALFNGTVRAKDTWCSICPALATYECETPGAIDTFGNASCGCGLQLCETCMLSLTGQHDGNLQEMLGELEDESSDERPLGLRADYELLKEDGLLMRYILWATEE